MLYGGLFQGCRCEVEKCDLAPLPVKHWTVSYVVCAKQLIQPQDFTMASLRKYSFCWNLNAKPQKHVSADVEVSKKGCDMQILYAKHFIITLFFLLLCNGSKAVKATEPARFMCPLGNAWQWSYSNKPFVITVQGSFLFGVILFVIIHSMHSQPNNIYSDYNPLNLHYHIWGNKNINKHIRSIKVSPGFDFFPSSVCVTAQDCLAARCNRML